MTDLIIDDTNERRSDIAFRLDNSQMMDVDAISESVICAAEYVTSLFSYGLPKTVYQLALFNLLSKQGFKLQIQDFEPQSGMEVNKQKEIIIVNEILVIECVVQNEIISDSQRRLMFDHDNHSVTGIIVNFGDGHTKNPITRVYQNSVLH